MSLYSELMRRNVVRVAIGYLAGSWLLLQVLQTLFPIFGLPETSIRVVVVLLAIGLAPVLILSWKFEWTPEGIRRDEGPARGKARPSTYHFDRIVTVLLVLALVYFAVDKFVLAPARDAAQVREAREEGRVEGTLAQYSEKSIVVLPMLNLSADPEQEYFADGLTEELLNLLAQTPQLRVISRSTAFTFKGKDIAVADIAKRLNVSHVLEGSVRKSGDRIRISTQLIDARTDTQMWSQTYDQTLADVFAIQDKISAQVVAQLKLRLVGSATRNRSVDPRAHELYLQAHYILETDQIDKLDVAQAKLQQALQIQPDYVVGMGELARVWYRLPIYTDLMSETEMRTRVREMIARMAAIAPTSGFTNTWQAYVAEHWDRDYQTAARHYERAIADNPFTPTLLRSVARFLLDIGRTEEAYALSRYIVARDPACAYCLYTLAWVARAWGHPRQAAKQLGAILQWQKPPDMSSLYWNLGVLWLEAGEPARALETFDKLRDIDPKQGTNARLYALYDLGRKEEFEKGFEHYRNSADVDPGSVARLYAWSGDNDQAFAWLDKMVQQSGPESARWVKTDMYDRLKSDPRWPAFLEKNHAADPDFSAIEFHPGFPPELEQAIERYAGGADD